MGNSEEGNALHFEDQQQRVFTHSDESKTTVNTGLINTGHICYTNAYLQTIASCSTLPPCLKMPPNASLQVYQMYHAFTMVLCSLVRGSHNSVDPIHLLDAFNRRYPDFSQVDVSDSNPIHVYISVIT